MISTSVVNLDRGAMPEGSHVLTPVDCYSVGRDTGDEDPGAARELVFVYAHRASECSSCIERAKVATEREAHRAKAGWQEIDGFVHIVGRCPSCEPEWCPRCKLKLLHDQPIYAGIAYECEHCNAERWEQGPVPAHDEIGMVL